MFGNALSKALWSIATLPIRVSTDSSLGIAVLMRVKEAERILREEQVASSAVHALVGIADKSNFHKLFRKRTGMTPQEYKESMHS